MIDVPTVRNNYLSKPHIEPGETLVIGAMGRLVAKKGFAGWLESLAMLRDNGVNFSAILGGDGEEKQALIAQINHLGLHSVVRYIGWVDDRDSFFRQIDIFVCPSSHEPFGIVLLEAMARSIPLITTAAEGPREIIVNGEDGLVIPINNPKALADAQRQMLADPNLRSNCAQRAYNKLCTNYDRTVVGEVLEKTLQNWL